MPLSQHDTSAVAMRLVTQLCVLFHRKTNSWIPELTLFCLEEHSFADHLACSFPEANVGMENEWGRLGLSAIEQTPERINSLTIRLLALHCWMFLQQRIIPALEVLSNSYYSIILWCYFDWEFQMGAFLQQNKYTNCLQFGLLGFGKCEMLYFHQSRKGVLLVCGILSLQLHVTAW